LSKKYICICIEFQLDFKSTSQGFLTLFLSLIYFTLTEIIDRNESGGKKKKRLGPAHLTQGTGGREEVEEESRPWSCCTSSSEHRRGPGQVWLKGER